MTNDGAPALTELTAPYWTTGGDGVLRIQRCRSCGWWLHPPSPLCRRCHGRDLRFEATSGRGTLWSYTVSRVAWGAGLEPPYVVAEVELVEQPGLRVLTTIVDSDDLAIGMPVHVRFRRVGGVWAPVFAP
jgi:uncharacterized OB-fold protein